MSEPTCPCRGCGHPATYHHPDLTRGDGCIGRPFTTELATLSEIRAGRVCGCPTHPDGIPGWFEYVAALNAIPAGLR